MDSSELSLLRTAISQAWNAVVITDANAAHGYPVAFANPAFCRMTGYTLEELRGNSLKMLQGPATDPALLNEMRICLREGRFFEGQTTNYRKDGTPYIVQWNISPVLDGSGAITHFVSVQRDMTEVVQTGERERMLSQALNVTSDPIFLTDLNSRIVFANTALTLVSGYSVEELRGQTPRLLSSGKHDRVFYQRLYDTLKQGKNFKANFVNRRRDGTHFHLEQSISPLLDESGKATHYISVGRDVTERVAIEKRLQNTLDQRERLAKHVPGVLYQFRLRADGSSHFPYASQGIQDIYGVTAEAVADDASAVYQVLHPDDLGRVSERIMASAHTLGVWHDVYRVCRPDGSTIWVEGEATPEAQADGSVLWHGYIRDVTVRRQSEEAMRLAANVFTFSHEGITITDHEARIVEVNQAFSDITGYTREEVLGRNPKFLSSGRQDPAFYAAMWEELLSKGHWSGEIWNRRKDGREIAELLTVSAVRDAQGEVCNYIGLFSDITALKEQQDQLERMAHYDALTSLPNRFLMADRLRQSMAQAPRRGQSLAVAYLDLDEFKSINDSHGHEVGDQLLVTIAQRIDAVLREGDTVSRIGGDEFVVVLLDLGNVGAAAPVLSRIIEAAAQPVAVGDRRVQVTVSMGVTFFPQQQPVDADQLLRQADQAMYQAKQAGKNHYHVFDAEQDLNVRRRFERVERIRRAKTDGELVLYYQPKVNMRTGQFMGAEALIRWLHPERGLLPPGEFLPAIENHPLFVSVGQWVIEAALAQMDAWQRTGLTVPVSVNVGSMQLQDPDFVTRLRGLLDRYPSLQPGSLQLEVLETSAIDAHATASQLIQECQAMGVSFALDDFGTGYSSLTYLKQLPAELLKIDMSFVRGMLEDPEDLAIVEGVLGLSRVFRRGVIAEGVETLAHGEVLLRLGCEQGQGYAIARPMPAHELINWLANWQTPDAWKALTPVSREVLPALMAAAEHRAWMNRIVAYLDSEKPASGGLDAQKCHFDRWFDSEGDKSSPLARKVVALDALHRTLHDTASQLIALKREGKTEELRQRLPELLALSESLVSQLDALY